MENTDQNWDRMAAAYEDFTAGADSYSYRIEWPCIEKLLPDLHEKSVIDLGCGTADLPFCWRGQALPGQLAWICRRRCSGLQKSRRAGDIPKRNF